MSATLEGDVDPTLPTYNFVDPPTGAQIASAKLRLVEQQTSAANLQAEIKHAEDSLRQIVEDSQRAIATLQVEQQKMQREIELTLAYISPIRSLPDEILREIFLYEFEIHPCSAWVLAAVCSLWRKLVLRMPRLWSKIRIVTTPDASPDTIRLWLERSGRNIPLDIEIFLRVSSSDTSSSRNRPMTPFRAGYPPINSPYSPVMAPPPDWFPPPNFPTAHVLPFVPPGLDGTITPPLVLPPPAPANPPLQGHGQAITVGQNTIIISGGNNNNVAGAGGGANANNAHGGHVAAIVIGMHAPHGHGAHNGHAHGGINPHLHHHWFFAGNGAGGGGAPPPFLPIGGAGGAGPSSSPNSRVSSPDKAGQSRSSSHWGHVAIFYLVEQIHRWKRFVFRFEKHFASVSALKSITGNAPLLEEFEISCADAAHMSDCWLPSLSANSKAQSLPKLASVTLQHIPFTWSSPLLTGGSPPNIGSSSLASLLQSRPSLTSLSLRALSGIHAPIQLDRILYIMSANPALKNFSLHYQAVSPAVLPLSPTALNELEVFHLGGHYILSNLLDALTLPSLTSLTLDVEPREPFDEIIPPLLTRSHNPIITHLSLSYHSVGHYYSGPALMGLAPWNFLASLNSVTSLQIGHSNFDSILTSLANIDDDSNTWLCPNLTRLALRSCAPHGDGVSKLISMVEARNPSDADGAGNNVGAWGAGVPAKLKVLEVYDCASLGEDVLRWLRSRIDDVRFSEPLYRTPRSPPYDY